MSEMQVAVLFIAGLVLVEIIKLTVGRVFRKTIDTEYVTVARCRKCREECSLARSQNNSGVQDGIRDLGQSVDTLRGVILVMAVKVGVEESTLEKLAYKRRTTDK